MNLEQMNLEQINRDRIIRAMYLEQAAITAEAALQIRTKQFRQAI